MMQSYESLVEIALSPDADEHEQHEAFGELVNRFQDAAYRWAYHVLEDSDLAQDAAQEAFITAYHHLDQLREAAAFPGWLKQIVLSRCNRMTRRKQPATTPYDDEGEMTYSDPEAEVEDKDWREKVIEAVNDLPEHERTVTELFYVTGYSQREIAEQLAIPLTTVKKRLQYARERLRTAIPLNDAPVAALHGADWLEARLDRLIGSALRPIPLEDVFADWEVLFDKTTPLAMLTVMPQM